MKKIIEVLRLKYAARLSHEKIARACGLSKGAVGKYVSATQALGITWPLPEGVDQARLEALLFPARQPSSRLVEPDYFQMHQALKRKGVTLQLLWAEYVAVHGESGYRYSQYCHRYRQWRDRQKRSLRQVHLAGDKLFIDYCGPTVPIVDRHTGEMREAQVFVSVLGASSYTYAEATYTQSLPDWIASHQRALAFYGGVPALLVPDNLKSAVDLADRYDALVMVDDSHSTGFIGKTGRGTLEYHGVMERVDIITSTFGKALGGASGGFTSGRKEIIDMLRQRSRPYLFSNTLAPGVAAAVFKALETLSASTELRDRLERNTRYFREGMTKAGFKINPGDHPIVPIMLGDAKVAVEMADAMLAEGVYVIAFSYPVVPKGKARIRTKLSAAHTQEHIDKAVAAFIKVGKELGTTAPEKADGGVLGKLKGLLKRD